MCIGNIFMPKRGGHILQIEKYCLHVYHKSQRISEEIVRTGSHCLPDPQAHLRKLHAQTLL